MMCNRLNALNLIKSPKKNKVVELFDKIPAKQKSYQSALNYNGFAIFCKFLPSIRRVPSASKKCERIIVKCNQNDFVHVSRTLLKYEFWPIKITQLWHFGSNLKNQRTNKIIAKINQNTMCVRHRNEPKVNILLRITAKSCTFLYQHLVFPNKMLYYFFERLQYFSELDLQQFMKEQVNSYFTLLEINIITRRWGYSKIRFVRSINNLLRGKPTGDIQIQNFVGKLKNTKWPFL